MNHMKIKKIITFILPLSIVISCKDSSKEIKTNFSLIASDTLQIPIDTLTRPYTNSIQYLEKDDELMFFSEISNRILIYDLKTNQLKQELVIQEEGENGLGKDKFEINMLSKDSILVSTSMYNFFIINSKGKILYKKNFLKQHNKK